MTIYTCETCEKQFNRKSTYDNHLDRKNPCKLDNNTDNQCLYCEKGFTTKFNLNKHLKKCSKKLIDDNNKLQMEELKKIFEEKFEKQQKQIEQLSHIAEINNISVTENIHNTTNNITNTINIYSSGKEDLSILSKEDIIKLCTSGTYYPIVAVEILHCNDKYPEFQNVLISNLRASTGLVKINDKWETKSHDELLTNIMRVDKKHISALMKDLKVDTKLKVKLESTQDEIDTNESKEHHRNKIKRRLYDASKMIKKNKEKSSLLV